MNITERHSI